MGSNIRERFAYLWRQVRRVFHLALALVFMVLGAMGAFLSYQLWRESRRSPSPDLWAFGAVAALTLALFMFGLYSLVKARRVR